MGLRHTATYNFPDNMNYRHDAKITRVSTTITQDVPQEADIFGDYFAPPRSVATDVYYSPVG